ncbi:hypothetical protein Moror_12932 [Moniliophthora roreri MCA 2997]|nr:hypothetical protein Moror_12932 [Moniliophthora roreri MCA 2997]
MDFPATLTLVGIDPFLSDDEARRVRELLERDEELMASLDAEIAQVKAALAELKERRDMAQQNIALNYAPSESEAMAIRSEIDENESRLRALEEEIARAHRDLDDLLSQRQQAVLDATLASTVDPLSPLDTSILLSREAIRRLEIERDSIHVSLEQHRALLSPIRRIPTEMLAEIFQRCLPDELYVRPSPQDAPLLLGQVCSSWRQLALGTSSLWSSIHITVDEKGCHPHLPLVEVWLSRSATKPLAIRIDENLRIEGLFDHVDEGLVTGAAVLRKFYPAYNRWRHLCLTYSDWRTEDLPLRGLTVSPPPLLESLSLTREYWLGDIRDVLRALLAGPNLRRVFWRGIIAGHPNPGEIMSTSTLRELHVENLLTKEQLYSILQNGPDLEICGVSVFFASPSSHHTESIVQIQLPHLKEFSVTTDRADGQVFDVVSTPCLSSLTIQRLDGPSIFQDDGGMRFWSQRCFSNLVQRSSCKIRSLDLSETDIEPDELVATLRLLSGTLENLSLSNDHTNHFCVNDAVLRSLTPSHERADMVLCPRLTFTKLWGCTLSTDGLVGDFLESRWNPTKLIPGVQQLSMAMVKFSSEGRHSNDIARLQALNAMRRGLTLIRTRPGEV